MYNNTNFGQNNYENYFEKKVVFLFDYDEK